jgi:hypothetical protein
MFGIEYHALQFPPILTKHDVVDQAHHSNMTLYAKQLLADGSTLSDKLIPRDETIS